MDGQYIQIPITKHAKTTLNQLTQNEWKLLITYLSPRMIEGNMVAFVDARIFHKETKEHPTVFNRALAGLKEKGLVISCDMDGWLMVNPLCIYKGYYKAYGRTVAKWLMLTNGETNEDRQDSNARGSQEAQTGSTDPGGDHAEGAGGCGLPADPGSLHQRDDKEVVLDRWERDAEEPGDGVDLPGDVRG